MEHVTVRRKNIGEYRNIDYENLTDTTVTKVKKPWLAALLCFFFAPFGMFYFGWCSQHFLPVYDPKGPDQKVNSITLDSWVCDKFVEK